MTFNIGRHHLRWENWCSLFPLFMFYDDLSLFIFDKWSRGNSPRMKMVWPSKCSLRLYLTGKLGGKVLFLLGLSNHYIWDRKPTKNRLEIDWLLTPKPFWLCLIFNLLSGNFRKFCKITECPGSTSPNNIPWSYIIFLVMWQDSLNF